jgi:1,4-alpha-glucan branching enzyme
MYRVLELNPQLQQYAGDIDYRMKRYHETRARLLPDGKTLKDFANAHHYYGIHWNGTQWVYREWAPGADRLYFMGDFNGWNKTSHPMTRLEGGNWEIVLDGWKSLWPGCRVKTVVDANGEQTEHIPLYARRVVQDPKTVAWTAEVVDEGQKFEWTDQNFCTRKPVVIYEAHIGMASQDGHVGTYTEFADEILPRIKEAGYNTIQLMAIMEHPYYGSFGYQVSNFYAATSRFGTPEELKRLVNKAHRMGIQVIMDLVHSHAVKNTAEGINRFDGTDTQFFHAGDRGYHKAWDTKCFNYGKDEVIHFLLSNLKFWMEEYHFDGFRFDGVTSMLYLDHGLGVTFDSDKKYFSLNTDVEAVTYLQLANALIRELKPDALTIAEDMSGMPGMALPIADGGIGFDYRLAMGMPDLWVRLLKEKRDEEWDIGQIWGELCLRRAGEKTVAYVECHDQALVGDKTLMFRLADARMYTDMDQNIRNPEIDRAMSLHKLIRLMSYAGGGDAYLNFMGNEFGHPEWIDFPREGNNWSVQYCRRQWNLLDNKQLKYRQLSDFDQDMVALAFNDLIFEQSMPDLIYLDSGAKVIAFRRSNLMFVFNFNPTQNYEPYWLPVAGGGPYEIVMASDDRLYGGDDRVVYKRHMVRQNREGQHKLPLVLPARTAIVVRVPKTQVADSELRRNLPRRRLMLR